jgi:lipoyl(octanoyl) transferase
MPIRFTSFDQAQPYTSIFNQMRDFTLTRDKESDDQIWFMEHEPVFTQGQAGKAEHILNPHDIPVVQSDRGGQVTYHGPGQLMTYCLINLRAQPFGARALVTALENSFIELLASFDLKAIARSDAPGVYVNDAKIASIGLRIRKGCCYHGVSFNYALDLAPFAMINPCGFKQLAITRLIDYVPDITRAELEQRLRAILLKHLQPFREELSHERARSDLKA